MRKLWFLALAVLFTSPLISGMAKASTSEMVPRMTVDELRAELGSPDLLIVDVRSDRDWRKSDRKIAGAIREDSSKPQVWAEKYGKGTKIVLYCT